MGLAPSTSGGGAPARATAATAAAAARPPPPPPGATPLGERGTERQGARERERGETRDQAPHSPPSLSTPSGNPLPPTLHAVLDPLPGRAIIVGDVHGCIDELNELLVKCRFDPKSLKCPDTLIFVGDLVNKGPASAAVLDAAIAHGAITVRGNHDEAALAAAAAPSPPPPHMAWVADAAAARGLRYLAATPFSLAIPSRGVLVVHAGLVPGPGGVEGQALEDLVELRYVAPAEGGSPPSPSSPSPAAAAPRFAPLDKALAKALKKRGAPVRLWADAFSDAAAAARPADRAPRPPSLPPFPHVVFGHHASARLQRDRAATGIDTACVAGGALTALVLPAKAPKGPVDLAGGYQALGGKLVSVKAKRTYCGEE